MEFKSGRSESPWSSAQKRQSLRSSLRSSISAADSGGSSRCGLQMYLLPPAGDISIEEFDSLAVERLQVLRTFERAEQSGKQKYSSEWNAFVLNELKRLKLQHYIHLLDQRDDLAENVMQEACRRDHVSHFILRLAYCRTDELRNWFITHELAMFRMRFLAHKSSDSYVTQFLAENDIHISKVSNAEKEHLSSLLREATARLSPSLFDSTNFYSVPFSAAAELVRQRKVLVRAGLAYLPTRDLSVVAAVRLRTHLQRALASARRQLPVVEHDRRLRALLADFDKQYTGRDYSAPSSEAAAVTADMLDELSEKSFPPCMRQLHCRLRAAHKLLHGGRMQYGLFLKAIGLSLNEAIKFWRNEFTQIMDADKFQKQYLYNIRHNYGQEGKRTSYTAYTCSKVIGCGGGSDAGCPFKHCDRDHLVKLLSKLGVNSQDTAEMCDTAARGQPQLACQLFWQHSHGGSDFPAGAIMHPNQYYEESRKFRSGGAVNKHAGLDSSKFVRATMHCSQTSRAEPWDESVSNDDLEMALASTNS